MQTINKELRIALTMQFNVNSVNIVHKSINNAHVTIDFQNPRGVQGGYTHLQNLQNVL